MLKSVRDAKKKKAGRGLDIDPLDLRLGLKTINYINFRFKDTIKLLKPLKVKAEDRADLRKHIKNLAREEFKEREQEIKNKMIKEDYSLRNALESGRFELRPKESPGKSLKEILGKQSLDLEIDYSGEFHFQDRRGKKTSKWKKTRFPASILNKAPSVLAPRGKTIRKKDRKQKRL